MASAADEELTSGDFMVLETTSSRPELSGQGAVSSSRPEPPGQDAVSQEKLARECEEAIRRLCDICGSEDDGKNQRPFRIVVVGKHGAGKSSFINGVAAALSRDRWHEYALTGYLGKAEPITIGNQRLVKCANDERERYSKVLLPTIIDVAGLSDEVDDKVEELLRLLFYGHIEEDEPLMKIYLDIKDKPLEEIRAKYSQSYPEMRVDRVIFVASAADSDSLPERLMTSVHRVAQPSHSRTERRAVPIYGVLTKKDKVDLQTKAYLDKKSSFMQGLGLNQSRFCVCTNYCDDVDPEGQRTRRLRPELDLPLLEFMQLVCDRALRVVKESEGLPGTQVAETKQKEARAERQEAENRAAGSGLAAMWHDLDPLYRDAVWAAVAGMLTLGALFLLLPSSGQGNGVLSQACTTGAIKDPTFRELLCKGQESSAWAKYLQVAVQIVVAAAITVVVFLFQHINRRL